jgi:hypothetical protein
MLYEEKNKLPPESNARPHGLVTFMNVDTSAEDVILYY